MEILLERVWHKEKDCLAVKFKYDTTIFNLLRKIEGGRWSKTHRAWLYDYKEKTVNKVCELLKENNSLTFINDLKGAENPEGINDNVVGNVCALSHESEEKVKAFKTWMRSRRYSENTIGTYTDALKIFLRFYDTKSVSEITNNDVITFNNDYVLKNKLSASLEMGWLFFLTLQTS